MNAIITKIKTWNEKRQHNRLRRRKIREWYLGVLYKIVTNSPIVLIIFLCVLLLLVQQSLKLSVIVAIAAFFIATIQTMILLKPAGISKEQNEIAKYRYNPGALPDSYN